MSILIKHSDRSRLIRVSYDCCEFKVTRPTFTQCPIYLIFPHLHMYLICFVINGWHRLRSTYTQMHSSQDLNLKSHPKGWRRGGLNTTPDLQGQWLIHCNKAAPDVQLWNYLSLHKLRSIFSQTSIEQTQEFYRWFCPNY